ncbi:MAG: phytanoyl-CoA dioxygenase family protein [Gemmatimonadales bacterium]
MTASIPRLVAGAPTEHVVAGLREYGAVIVEGVLAPDLLARFNVEIDPILEQVRPDRSYLNPAIDHFYGDRVRQITGVATRSRIFAEEILCHPFYVDISDAILGPNCSRYQLNVAQVMDRGPGAERQMLHRDEDVWVHLPRPHGEVELASVIALVDFRAELGATVVVPGSHRWERGRQPKPAELACAEMPAGSAVVYLGSTIHAGGRNATPNRWRRGMHMSFVVGWLRTEENNYLSTPPEVARTLPRRSQELLGYAAHDAIAVGGGYLGTVDLLDPIDLLARGKL